MIPREFIKYLTVNGKPVEFTSTQISQLEYLDWLNKNNITHTVILKGRQGQIMLATDELLRSFKNLPSTFKKDEL